MDAKIMTLDQVAHYLQVSQRSVYDLARRKEIPAFKVASQWRFDRELLEAFIRQQSQVSAASGTAEGAAAAPTKSVP